MNHHYFNCCRNVNVLQSLGFTRLDVILLESYCMSFSDVVFNGHSSTLIQCHTRSWRTLVSSAVLDWSVFKCLMDSLDCQRLYIKSWCASCYLFFDFPVLFGAFHVWICRRLLNISKFPLHLLVLMWGRKCGNTYTQTTWIIDFLVALLWSTFLL